jgi:Acetyltransferase (GNAT) domain
MRFSERKSLLRRNMLQPIHHTLPVFAVNPLTDPRWDELVTRHPRAGVFHTSGWLSALRRSYGYEPVAFTTCCPSEPLSNGLVFCKVKSWITGRRLVSLPFSDHCDLLAASSAEQEVLLAHIGKYVARNGYAHAEIRPRTTEEPAQFAAAGLQATETFCLHRLSLDLPLDSLFHDLHRNCIQRKIQRAEKEGLVYESGRSEPLLRNFYDLVLRTRRRHSLPPQPLHWFRNLVKSIGDNLTIRLVSKDHRPVAAILTLSHKSTTTFKYGCSDERFSSLGGTPFLLWRTIQEAKSQGMHELDLGRSELSHAGLVLFKDRLGAAKTMLPYWRYPSGKSADGVRSTWQIQIAKGIFSWVPDPVFVASGRFLYRHIG